MKKLLSLVLVVLMASLFAACGDNGGDKCEGSGGIGEVCSDACPCTEGVCTEGYCATEAGCCPGQAYHVTVDGTAYDLTAQAPAQVDLAALDPTTTLLSGFGSANHKAEASSDATGAFSFDCFDATGISQGLILLTDDAGFDNSAGNYYPTVSGIASWPTAADKTCEEGATAMVFNNTFIGALTAGLQQVDGNGDCVFFCPDDLGIIIGTVVDANRSPLAGATVEKATGDPMTVLYPNADFTDFTGTSTSGTGIYIVGETVGIQALIGVKDGYTWDSGTYLAATIPGAIYFVPLVANE